MAKKITMDSVHAFIAGKLFRRENMEVTVSNGNVILRLHGNPIAKRTIDGKVYINTCGWFTVTTKERLNYLLYAFNSALVIRQKNWQWYLGDDKWDGEWTYIYKN